MEVTNLISDKELKEIFNLLYNCGGFLSFLVKEHPEILDNEIFVLSSRGTKEKVLIGQHVYISLTAINEKLDMLSKNGFANENFKVDG